MLFDSNAETCFECGFGMKLEEWQKSPGGSGSGECIGIINCKEYKTPKRGERFDPSIPMECSACEEGYKLYT